MFMGWRWFLVSWCYMSACVFSASQLGSKFTPAGLLWWKYTLCLSFSPQFCFVFQHFCFGLCVFIWMKTSYHNKSTTSFFSSMQKVPMLLLLLWQQTLFSFFSLFGSACIQSKWDLCRDSSGSTYCIQFIPSWQHSYWNAATIARKILHLNLGWHQKLELQDF